MSMRLSPHVHLFVPFFLIFLISQSQAGRGRVTGSTGIVNNSPSRPNSFKSSSASYTEKSGRPFSAWGTTSNRGRFSSLYKSLKNPSNDPSYMDRSFGKSSRINGDRNIMNQFAGANDQRFPSSSDVQPKNPRGKLAAAGLLGGSIAAGAYALRGSKSPYEYGRVVSSYGSDDTDFDAALNPYDSLDSSYSDFLPSESDVQKMALYSSSRTTGMPKFNHTPEQSQTDQMDQGAKAMESTEPSNGNIIKEAEYKKVTTPEEITETTKTRVVIESGESHDLFGSARRGQKEELQGDRTNSISNRLSHQQYASFNYPNEYDRIASGRSTFGDVYFVAIVAGVGVASIFGVIGTGYCLYRVNRHAKATADIEYPAYGVVGPITKDPPSTHSAYSSGNVSPTGDRKLAQTAQMYHYHHQKAAMMASASASRSSSAVPGKRLTSTSEGDSEEEADEIDYIVYECPGLAPTGEMEVKNPLFHDDSAPASPAKGPSSLTKSPDSSAKVKGNTGNKKYTVNDDEDLK